MTTYSNDHFKIPQKLNEANVKKIVKKWPIFDK